MSGETVEVTVHGIALGGSGVGRTEDGQVVFVPRTAPGDRVRAELTERRKRWARGRLIEVCEHGPRRVEPSCGVFALCGGCTLMHLSEDAQREALGQGVRDALARIGGVEVPVDETASGGHRLGYRNRVRFTLRRRGGRVFAGYHAETGGRVVDVETCPLAEPAINQAWGGLRDAWGPGAIRLPDGGELRVSLRASEEGRVGMFVSGGRPADGEALDALRVEARRLLRRVPVIAGYWWRPGEGERVLLAGEGHLTDTWGSTTLDLRPEAFLQVNREVAPLIERHVDELLGDVDGRTIVDLYGGVGLRGLRWSLLGGRTITVEAGGDAVATGREAAERAGGEVQFVESTVEAALANDVAAAADAVVVNPPRTGLSEEAATRLCEVRAAALVYVSCDPATLARDVKRMKDAWTPERARPFDAFPQTGHVETVVSFRRMGESA